MSTFCYMIWKCLALKFAFRYWTTFTVAFKNECTFWGFWSAVLHKWKCHLQYNVYTNPGIAKLQDGLQHKLYLLIFAWRCYACCLLLPFSNSRTKKFSIIIMLRERKLFSLFEWWSGYLRFSSLLWIWHCHSLCVIMNSIGDPLRK